MKRIIKKNKLNITRIISVILMVMPVLIGFYSCSDEVAEPSATTLNELLPEAATAGDSLTLTGSGFGDEQGTNRVLFGTTAADTYSLWSDSTIVVTIPDFSSAVDVSVEIDGVGSNVKTLSVSSSDAVELSLLAVFPTNAEAGELVTISGNLFGTSQEDSQVYFGDYPAEEYRLWSSSTIIAVVPDDAQSGGIYVNVDDNITGSLDFSINPSIDSIQPSVAHAGEVLSVIGTGFSDAPGVLQIGGVDVETYYTWTNKVIVCKVPDEASVGLNTTTVVLDASVSDTASLSILWNSITTAEGLSSNSIYDVFTDEDELWAATWGSGLNFSNDGGQSWIRFSNSNGLPSNYIRTLGKSGSAIWAGTNNGLSKSMDNGSTWTTYTTASGLGNNYIYSIAFDSASGNVWAGTNGGGLSKTDDDGNTWKTYNTVDGLGSNYIYDIYIEDDSTVWAATGGGISYSEDNGSTWTNINTSDGLSSNSCRAVFADTDAIWTATTSQLNKSTDRGNTWTHISTLDGMCGNYCLSMYVDEDSVMVGTNGYGLSKSEDGGVSWENFTTSDGLNSNVIRAVDVRQQQIYLATGIGISTAHQ